MFGRTAERRWERQLLADYEAALDAIEAELAAGNHATALALAAYPQKDPRFGHVKQAQARPALAERERLHEGVPGAGGRPFAEAAE